VSTAKRSNGSRREGGASAARQRASTRSIWNGALAFGDVCVAVKLFSAVDDHAVHFHEVRLRDGCRIVHRRVGSESGREVPAQRIGKAYETSRGHRVVLEDDEIAAARGSRPKVIEIEHFVEAAQIDSVHYEHPYILGAQPGGERAYRVLHSALEHRGAGCSARRRSRGRGDTRPAPVAEPLRPRSRREHRRGGVCVCFALGRHLWDGMRAEGESGRSDEVTLHCEGGFFDATCTVARGWREG
jgi:hypothetical protein